MTQYMLYFTCPKQEVSKLIEIDGQLQTVTNFVCGDFREVDPANSS